MKTLNTSLFHKLLQRQLRKYSNPALDENEAFQKFVESVNESYNSYEKDKEISDHAYSLTQIEFNEINTRLREEVELRKLSLQKLKNSIKNLKSESADFLFNYNDDFFEIVHILDEEINSRKKAESLLVFAKEEAEQASRAKSEFLSIMSHEIRTPLNAVIGMGHLLIQNNPRIDQIDNLEVLKISADNLLVLINNILDFNKIEAGKLELEETGFNIRKLIQNTVIANTQAANERENNINLFIDEQIPDFFIGDYVRLGQVINNLVSNAIKFTRKGYITVQLDLVNLNEYTASLCFLVKDTGLGISNDKLETIFSPFMQESTATTRKYGGTGLGLAISQKIINQLHSHIEVQSEIGKGSEFSFCLELKRANAQDWTHEEEDEVYFDLKDKKILLVEDTLYNVFYATQLLEGWNARVDCAENGSMGLEKVQHEKFDLILMDLHMPVMDGYESTRNIRKFNTQIPIIALTASATSNVREKVMKAGMQDYVTKPFNPDDLFYKLKKYLG